MPVFTPIFNAASEKGQEQEAIEQFKEAYKILKIQNLSNPYDINTLLYRCITLIEAKEYKKCHEILNGIDRLGEENYLKKADEIRKLMAIKKDEKKDHIILEKEIITNPVDSKNLMNLTKYISAIPRLSCRRRANSRRSRSLDGLIACEQCPSAPRTHRRR